jgi:outer membrane protein TolC
MMGGKLPTVALVLFTLGDALFGQAATQTVPQAVESQGVASQAAAQAAAQDTTITLTLDRAIARAMANQPLIQQAEAAVEAARARVGEAQSAYYPNVSAAAVYTRLEPDESISFPGLGNFSLVPVNNWDFNVGLRQVIFQFGRRGVQVKLAENGVSAAQIGVEQIRMSIVFQAAQGFYTVLFLKEQLMALNEQLHNLQEHLSATQVKVQTGSATRYDVLSTGVRISALQSQLIEADNQYQKQSIALKQLLGMEESAHLLLNGGFTPMAEDPSDEQSQLASAMAHRPEVLQAVESESAAELNRSLATMGAWPTISAHASMGFKNGILTSQNLNNNVPVFNWVAGIQVSVPVFQGLLIVRQGEEADKKLLAARENTLAVKRNVTTQVLQALQDSEASRKQVQSAQSQLDQAKEMLEVVKLQYDLGMLTNLEYLDAQAALERAQLGSLQAQYREVLSEFAVKQATGAVIWTASPGSAGQSLRQGGGVR